MRAAMIWDDVRGRDSGALEDQQLFLPDAPPSTQEPPAPPPEAPPTPAAQSDQPAPAPVEEPAASQPEAGFPMSEPLPEPLPDLGPSLLWEVPDEPAPPASQQEQEEEVTPVALPTGRILAVVNQKGGV